MNSGGPSVPEPRLQRELFLAFSPVHKSAFGIAIATVSALLVFGLTVMTMLQPPESHVRVELLAVYFRGYSLSWAGALIGAGWAAVAGFVFGWFLAFCRNLVLAVSLFVIRTRAQLAETRDFLDHI